MLPALKGKVWLSHQKHCQHLPSHTGFHSVNVALCLANLYNEMMFIMPTYSAHKCVGF